jgi:hypothetical protein
LKDAVFAPMIPLSVQIDTSFKVMGIAKHGG